VKIKIRHHFDNSILFTATAADMAHALQRACKAGADLSGADLRGADLSGADLRGAALSGANLSSANLRGANLSSAVLSNAVLSEAVLERADFAGADFCEASIRWALLVGADLMGANLERSDLRDSDLRRVNLCRANLREARLERANLYGAHLTDTNLSAATLAPIRDDLHTVLTMARAEAPGLLAALREGRIDGSMISGACACLVGTIANVRGVLVNAMEVDLDRPAERWFNAIRPGMLPTFSTLIKLTETWIVEWMAAQEMRP